MLLFYTNTYEHLSYKKAIFKLNQKTIPMEELLTAFVTLRRKEIQLFDLKACLKLLFETPV